MSIPKQVIQILLHRAPHSKLLIMNIELWNRFKWKDFEYRAEYRPLARYSNCFWCRADWISVSYLEFQRVCYVVYKAEYRSHSSIFKLFFFEWTAEVDLATQYSTIRMQTECRYSR